MKETDIETILQDFGGISEKSFDYFKKRVGIPFAKKEKYEMNIDDFYGNVLFPSGIVWYGKVYESDRNYAKPGQYLKIKDDKKEIKKFLKKHLAKGWIGTGYDSFVPSSDYPVWMYNNCDNKEFKHIFEDVVSEMLVEEFARERKTYEEVEQELTDDITARVKRSGYAKRAQTVQDVVRIMIEEWAQARCRPHADKESTAYYAEDSNFTIIRDARGLGSFNQDEAESLVAKLRDAEWKFDNLEPDIVDRLSYLRAQSWVHSDAVKRFDQQYYCLIGLLEIITSSSGSRSLSDKTFPLVYEQIDNTGIAQGREIEMSWPYTVNVHDEIFKALYVTQPKNGYLSEFWKGEVRKAQNKDEAQKAVIGFFLTCEKEERKSKAAEIHGVLKEKGFPLDMNEYFHDYLWFIGERQNNRKGDKK